MKRMRRPWPADLGLALLPLHRHSSDPGLNLAFRHVPVTDDTAPARSVGQIGMGFNMGGNFRFNRLAKQLPGAGAQYLRQRISENDSGWRNATTVSSFMAYPFLRKIGVFINARIRRLHSPSPRFSYSSHRFWPTTTILQWCFAPSGALSARWIGLSRRSHPGSDVQGRHQAHPRHCLINASPTFDGAVKSCWPMACLYRSLRFGEEYLPVSALLVDKT